MIGKQNSQYSQDQTNYIIPLSITLAAGALAVYIYNNNMRYIPGYAYSIRAHYKNNLNNVVKDIKNFEEKWDFLSNLPNFNSQYRCDTEIKQQHFYSLIEEHTELTSVLDLFDSITKVNFICKTVFMTSAILGALSYYSFDQYAIKIVSQTFEYLTEKVSESACTLTGLLCDNDNL